MKTAKIKKMLLQAKEADRQAEHRLKSASKLVVASEKNVKATKQQLKKARKLHKEACKQLRIYLKAENTSRSERKETSAHLEKLEKKFRKNGSWFIEHQTKAKAKGCRSRMIAASREKTDSRLHYSAGAGHLRPERVIRGK